MTLAANTRMKAPNNAMKAPSGGVCECNETC